MQLWLRYLQIARVSKLGKLNTPLQSHIITGHLFLKALYWMSRGQRIKEQAGDTDNQKPSVTSTRARTSKVAKNNVLGHYIMLECNSRINM